MQRNVGKETRENRYAYLYIYLKKGLDEYKKRSFIYSFIVVLPVATGSIFAIVQIEEGSVFWEITKNIYVDIGINIFLLDLILGFIIFLLFSIIRWDHNRTEKSFKGWFKEAQIEDEEMERNLGQTVEENKPETPLYKYLKTTKHVTIFSDRHGVIQRTAEIEILDKKNFTAIDYWFELDNTIKGLEFKEKLEQMQMDGVIVGAECRRRRFFGQTFVGKLFSMDNKEVLDSQRQLKVIPIEQQSNKKSFNIKFSKPIIDGNSVLKFGWAWTSYDLYPATKKDKEECVEKLDFVESSIVIDTKTDFLEFIISFEDGIKIDEYSAPTLYKKPQGGKEEEIGILTKENDMYYIRYKKGIPKPEIGDKYTVRWNYV